MTLIFQILLLVTWHGQFKDWSCSFSRRIGQFVLWGRAVQRGLHVWGFTFLAELFLVFCVLHTKVTDRSRFVLWSLTLLRTLPGNSGFFGLLHLLSALALLLVVVFLSKLEANSSELWIVVFRWGIVTILVSVFPWKKSCWRERSVPAGELLFGFKDFSGRTFRISTNWCAFLSVHSSC